MKENPEKEQFHEKLSLFPLFSGLNDDEKRTLASIMIPRSYKNKELLFAQSNRAEGFYLIVKGKLSVYRVGVDGKSQQLHLFGRGDICGEVPVFQGGSYPASAMAIGKAETLFVPGADFLDVCENNPGILLDMLAILSKRLRNFVEMIDDLSLKEVSARVAKFLLDQHVKNRSDVFMLGISKSMLASRLGTIAETLSRTLAKMQKAGVVSIEGDQVTINDKGRLELISAGEKI